jgi:hypothetical protein
MKKKAVELQNSGDYSDVYMHSKWSTILKGRNAAVTPDRLPDVAAVRWDGKIDIIEYSSSVGDRPQKIFDRNFGDLETAPSRDAWKDHRL